MHPLWFPTSGLIDPQLNCWASPIMLQPLLKSMGRVKVRYVGDHMWPAFRHGEEIEIAKASRPVKSGDAVVVGIENRVELFRVLEARPDALKLCGDADTGDPIEVPATAVIGIVTDRGVSPISNGRRSARRAWLDLSEAWRGQLSRPGATSVLHKYDSQAEYYARGALQPLGSEWSDTICRHVRPAGRVVVVGCGAGRECFALARLGFEVDGVDFSEAMVQCAQRLADQANLRNVTFHLADMAEFSPSRGAVDGVFFTANVYSFVPTRAARLALLRRMAGWLKPAAPLMLSARLIDGFWPRLMLGVQWLRHRGRGRMGDSHTRYFLMDGTEHRSFLHCFTPRSLERELRYAGFRVVAREHVWVLRRDDDATAFLRAPD